MLQLANIASQALGLFIFLILIAVIIVIVKSKG